MSQVEIPGVTLLDSPNVEVLGVGATRASRQASSDSAAEAAKK